MTARSSRHGCRASRQPPSEAQETHVLMNNCFANYGAVNARQVAKLLEDLAPTLG